MTDYESITHELVDFIEKSPSCYHVVDHFKHMLTDNGVILLREDQPWNIIPGKAYCVIRTDSSLIAFRIPEGEPGNYQLIAAHADSPSFKIKENPEVLRDASYVELNVEKYGGALMAPWFDRPLSIAGRVMTEEDGKIHTKLINFDRDLVMLPSLAIHMNRSANDNASYKVQSDMLPLFGDETAAGTFERMVAEQAEVKEEQILTRDLYLYNRTAPSFWGAHGEYFSSPKLDDLQCAFSSVKAFLNSKNDHSIQLVSIFDNEEVGSQSKNGAASTFLSDVILRIRDVLGYSLEKHLMMLSSGFMISADNAHAVHPNHMNVADPTNHPHLNQGVVLKFDARQKYTTDAVSGSIFKAICKRADVPVQVFFNHSDMLGGSTLGNISNTHISLNTVDIGAPSLAMHSPYETSGIKDTWYLYESMKAFYETYIRKDEEGNYVLEH